MKTIEFTKELQDRIDEGFKKLTAKMQDAEFVASEDFKRYSLLDGIFWLPLHKGQDKVDHAPFLAAVNSATADVKYFSLAVVLPEFLGELEAEVKQNTQSEEFEEVN